MSAQIEAMTEATGGEEALAILVKSVGVVVQLIVGVHVDAEILENIRSLSDVIELLLLLITVSIGIHLLFSVHVESSFRWVGSAVSCCDLISSISSRTTLL